MNHHIILLMRKKFLKCFLNLNFYFEFKVIKRCNPKVQQKLIRQNDEERPMTGVKEKI